MLPQWIPQNLQKRLLLYILQQLLLFSAIDLPNLEEVSLNNIHLRDVSIDPEKVGALPGCTLRLGKISSIELSGGVSGVNCAVSGVELVVAPTVENFDENLPHVLFLLAQSTASLASTVMFDREDEAVASESDSDSNSASEASSAQNSQNSRNTRSLSSSSSRRPSTLGGMMSRAAEIALLRLLVKVSDVQIKFVLDPADVVVHVTSVHFSASNGMRYVDFEGVKVCVLRANVNRGNTGPESPVPEEPANSDSDTDTDTDYADESMMESTVFTPEEAESIYMSATSQSFDKPPGEAVIAFVDTIRVNFEGLSRVSGLKIDVGTINVAAVPLVPTALLVLSCISKMVKLKNHLLRKHNAAFRRTKTGPKSRFPEYDQDDLVDDLMEDDATSPLFSKLHVKAMIISLTSALSGSGEFLSTHDDLSFDFRNVNAVQKDDSLVYGGIETLTLRRYVSGSELFAFSFESPTTSSADTSGSPPPNPQAKADVRFEFFWKSSESESSSEVTLLLSKQASCFLDCTSLQYMRNFSTSLAAAYDTLSGMLGDLKIMRELGLGALKTATASIEPGTKRRFLLQTAPFNIQVALSALASLKAVVYPISYNKDQEQMSLQRIIILSIVDGIEEHMLTIPSIVLKTNPQEFRSFACRPSMSMQRESTLTASTTLSTGTIKGSVGFHTLKALKRGFSQFWASFLTHNQKVNALNSALLQPPAKTSHSVMAASYSGSVYSNQTRLRRMKGQNAAVSFVDHGSPVQASFRLVIKEIQFGVTSLFEHFGNLDFRVRHVDIFHQSANVQGFVRSMSVTRRYTKDETTQVFFSQYEKDSNALPMALFAFKSGDKGSSTDFVLQRFRVEYYAHWLDLLKQDVTKGHNAETIVDVTPAPSSASATRTDIHVAFNDFILGLNPMRLSSKLCLSVSKGNMDFTFGREQFYIKSSFREVFIYLIDDTLNLKSDATSKLARTSPQSFLIASGFVMIGRVNTSHLGITVNTDVDEIKRRNLRHGISGDLSLVDVKMNSDELQVELCADSAHTLAQTANDLKPPTVFTDEDRFKVKLSDSFRFADDIMEQINAVQRGESLPEGINRDLSGKAPEQTKEADVSDFCIVDEYYNDVAVPETDIDLALGKLSLESSSANSNVDSSTILVVEDHFAEKARKSDIVIFPFSFNMNLSKTRIYLFDGFDWKHTRKLLRKSVKKLEARAKQVSESKKKPSSEIHARDAKIDELLQEDPEFEAIHIDNDTEAASALENDEDEPFEAISDTLFESMHFSLGQGDSPSDLVANINSQIQYDQKDLAAPEKLSELKVNVEKHYKDLKLNRSVIHKVLVDMKNIEVNLTNFTSRDPRVDTNPVETENEKVNNIDVRLDAITIYDNVPTSTWNKALTYMNILGEREVGTSMLRFSFLNVRPDPALAYSEAVLHVSILPIRLYIDQDTLEFVMRFFEFKDSRFLLPIDEIIYIQKLTVDPLKLKFDYKPKKVDYSGLRSGNNAELVNFFILDGSDISLREATVYGVAGLPKLGPALGRVYAPYIQKYQLAGLLAGLSPVRSIVNIGGGVKDLVAIPLKEYKKDGRLMRSLQKGTKSFAKTTTYELLKLGVKLASGTQVMLENLEEYFGGEGLTARRPQRDSKSRKLVETKEKNGARKNGLLESSLLLKKAVQVDRDPYASQKLYSASLDEVHEEDLDFDELQPSILIFDESSKSATPELANSEVLSENEGEYVEKMVSLYSNQPSNAKEGLRSAYKSLEKNLKSTKKKIVALKNDLQEADNFQELVASIAKSSPVIVIRPMIGTTEAVMKALMGISNGIDSRYITESQDKYRNERTNHSDG